MFRYIFLFLVAFATGGMLCGQETFRQYYGQPYPFAKEEGFSIEKIGANYVMIGTRENAANQSTDVALWYFDPVTLTLTDSTVLALPEDQRLYETYAGPDGGLLVIFERVSFSAGNDIVFSYFGPDGQLAWENELTNEVAELEFGGIQDITFRSNTELVMVFNTVVSGDELDGQLVSYSASAGFEGSFTYGEPGLNDIWSVEHQTNGDLLIAGNHLDNEVFVSLLGEDGTIKWERVFGDVEGSSGGLTYNFLSDVHRPSNDTVILVTGLVDDFARAFIIMDTLGNRLAENSLEVFSPRNQRFEQTTWFGDSLLFINDNVNNYSVVYPLVGYAPGSTYIEVETGVNRYSTRGSYFDASTRQIFSASRFLGEDEDAGIVRLDLDTQERQFKLVGKSGGQSTEKALGLEVRPDGGFLLLTRGLNPDRRISNRSNFLYVDNMGQPVDTVLINESSAQFAQPGIANVGQGDLLFLFRRNRQWDVYRYTALGELRWSTTIMGVNNLSPSRIMSLPDGRFAGQDIFERGVIAPPFNVFIPTAEIFVADSTGTVSDTVRTTRLRATTTIVGSQNDLIFAGTAYSRDSTIILSKDIESNSFNWEYVMNFGEGREVNVADIIQLTDGTYAAILWVKVELDNIVTFDLHYLHLNASGQESGLWELVAGLPAFQTPILREGVNGQLTIAFGTGSASAGGGEGQPYELRVHSLVAATGEEVLSTAFQSPFSATAPIDIEHLADGRTAIIADAVASDTSYSADVLLLVFDAEGNITNVQATRQLDVQLTVSPNPTADRILINLEELPVAPLDFLLYDATGRRLQQGRLAGTQTTVELGQYPAGSYFLLLRNQKGEMLTRQIIRQ